MTGTYVRSKYSETKCKMFDLLHFRVYLRVTRNSLDIRVNKTIPVPVKTVSHSARREFGSFIQNQMRDCFAIHIPFEGNCGVNLNKSI